MNQKFLQSKVVLSSQLCKTKISGILPHLKLHPGNHSNCNNQIFISFHGVFTDLICVHICLVGEHDAAFSR